MDTLEFLKESVETNIHKMEGVPVPDTITLAQLVRWIGFGFVPLPKEFEMKWQHLPIFEIGSIGLQTVPVGAELRNDAHELYMSVCRKILEYLQSGHLNAKYEMPDGTVTTFVTEFWNPDWVAIYWYESSVQFGHRLKFSGGSPSIVNCDDGSELFEELYKKYGNVKYLDVSFDTSDIVDVFDLKNDLFSRAFVAPDAKIKSHKDILYWIEFSDVTREITLNGQELLATPKFNSNPHRIFEYLYNNPFKLVTDDEIRRVLKLNTFPEFKHIISTLKMTGNLRNLFFDTSQITVIFHNPVTKSRAETKGITDIKVA